MAAVACTRRCGQSCYLERNFACDYRYQIRGQWKLTQAAPQPNWTRASRAAMSNRQDRARGPPRRASPGAFSDYAAGRPGGAGLDAGDLEVGVHLHGDVGAVALAHV